MPTRRHSGRQATPTSAGDEVRLGQVESRIMNVVWQRRAATVQDVCDALAEAGKPAYSTVLTMMRKLETKGYLRHTVDGRTYVYHPVLSRGQARGSLLRSLLARLFDNSPRELVNSLITDAELSPADRAEIRRLLAEDMATDDEATDEKPANDNATSKNSSNDDWPGER